MRKKEEEQGKQLWHFGKLILMGGITAFLLCIVFLTLAAAGISKGLISANLHNQITVVACVLSSFLGGLLVVREGKGRGVVLGIAVGAVLFLFQLSIGILIYDTFTLENGGIGLLCGALCGGAASGILSGDRTPRAKRKAAKRRR